MSYTFPKIILTNVHTHCLALSAKQTILYPSCTGIQHQYFPLSLLQGPSLISAGRARPGRLPAGRPTNRDHPLLPPGRVAARSAPRATATGAGAGAGAGRGQPPAPGPALTRIFDLNFFATKLTRGCCPPHRFSIDSTPPLHVHQHIEVCFSLFRFFQNIYLTLAF